MSVSNTAVPAAVTHAFNRFGLGALPSDPVPADPVAWLTGQLSINDPLANAAPSTAQGLGLVAAVLAAPPHSTQQTAAQTALYNRLAMEQQTSLIVALTTTTPFWERMVRFWTNHFAILAKASQTTLATSGSFVREAIRPNVGGTFVNMLLSVMQHPAMLSSLNNDQSIGPQSQRGLATGNGINENLARETLELFTLGLAGNFSQADVDALAYMLTGWTVSLSGPTTGFVVVADEHQPGPQTLLGTTYPGSVFDAYQALEFLGTHPVTYAHIATKLVTHFVSDTPDPNDVATVASALSTSGGSLPAAMTALIGLSSAWVPLTKLRAPADYALAAWRSLAAGAATAASDVNGLGQPVWESPFPDGWSDLTANWAAPAQMMLRTNWANMLATRLGGANPGTTANTALGSLISPSTTAMMDRVTGNANKLTILFCSPEFQRR